MYIGYRTFFGCIMYVDDLYSSYLLLSLDYIDYAWYNYVQYNGKIMQSKVNAEFVWRL
jgi:hypothetical protein